MWHASLERDAKGMFSSETWGATVQIMSKLASSFTWIACTVGLCFVEGFKEATIFELSPRSLPNTLRSRKVCQTRHEPEC